MLTLTKTLPTETNKIEQNVYTMENDLVKLYNKAKLQKRVNLVVFILTGIFLVSVFAVLNYFFPLITILNNFNSLWMYYIFYILFGGLASALFIITKFNNDNSIEDIMNWIVKLEAKKEKERKKIIKDQHDTLTKAINDTKLIMEYTQKIKDIQNSWGGDNQMLKVFSHLGSKQ